MKQSLLVFCALFCFSCIPLRIAPKIESNKVMVAKKFKRKLPKRYAFIFEDPKNANEFYNYINTKYELNHQDVEHNVPFIINNKDYFFSFHETEIPDKTLNLVPIAVDLTLKAKDWDPMFEGIYETRKGNWYLLLTVSDDDFNDCLKPGYASRDDILQYLREMQTEYLTTSNYLEALLRKEFLD